MAQKLLFPHSYKKIGWFILIPSVIAGLFLTYTGYESQHIKSTVFAVYSDILFEKSNWFSFIKTDITATVVGLLFIIGCMLVGFSKEREEDEYIANIRLSSLLWAVYVNYGLLFIAFLFIYGSGFFNVMVYHMFTMLIIFILRFNFLLMKNAKSTPDEK
jgi:hypothetical protein